MNNQELEKKIKELINMDNYFDMIIAARKFNPIYKTSAFYKTTRLSLKEVLIQAKQWYQFNPKDISNKIQTIIDNLSLDKINDIINQLGDTFEQENLETKQFLEDFKHIAK